VFCDQRGVVVNGFRTTLFDGGSNPTVQFCAVRFELGLIRHRANQRIVKHILRMPGERHLVDELGRQQVGNDRFDVKRRQQVCAESRAHHRRGAQRAFRLRVESVDARCDRRLQRGRNTYVGGLRGRHV